MPFYPFLGEGPPILVDYRKKKNTSGALILTSLLGSPTRKKLQKEIEYQLILTSLLKGAGYLVSG